MSTTHTQGRFVWHELATNDVKKAVSFYTELFGWKTEEMDMGPGGKYTTVKAGDTGVGGIVALQATEKAPPHWRTYCTALDVDDLTKKAGKLGGKVVVPPMDIPNVGRFAAIADPQGAVLLPFRDQNEPAEPQGVPAVGTFCWDELMTSDPAGAASFYSAIYGWTVTEQPMGAMGTYRVLKRGERMSGGIMGLPAPGIPPHWVAYVAVADLDASAKRVESLRGQVIVPPTDIPGMGRFAAFADTTGAHLSLFQGKP